MILPRRLGVVTGASSVRPFLRRPAKDFGPRGSRRSISRLWATLPKRTARSIAVGRAVIQQIEKKRAVKDLGAEDKGGAANDHIADRNPLGYRTKTGV